MTIEEAIQHSYDVAAGEKHSGECAECRDEHLQLAHWLEELVKLRGEKLPNAPLTLDELNLMVGEPIFISGVGEQVLDWEPQYRICSEKRQTVKSSSERYKMYFLYPDSYGKTWIAYRQRPKKWRPVRPILHNDPLTLEELRDMHGEEIKGLLTKGTVYEVESVQVYGWCTSIELKEFPGRKFNSVFFRRVCG